MLAICGQYSGPSKKLVELYHNAAAVDSISDTQFQTEYDQTNCSRTSFKKPVPPKVQCWYREMPSKRKILSNNILYYNDK